MSETRSRSPRRLLVVAPFPPRTQGLHGGSRTIARLLERLAAKHEVALICLRRHDEDPVDGELRKSLRIVEEVQHPAPVGRFPLAQLVELVRLAAGKPRWVRELSAAPMRERVFDLVRSWLPDLVQVEYPVMMQYAETVQRGTPLVLVEHDAAVPAAHELLARRKGLRRLPARADALAWKHFERAALQRASAVVVFTERDALAVRELDERVRIARIPLAPSLSGPLDPVGGRPPKLLFVGSFVHEPNIDAAIRLARDIFPVLKTTYPDLALALVGHAAPRTVRALAGERIFVHSDVPDVVPFLDEAAVVVAPIRIGGGLRVKVLDALAAGKALIASPRAVEGLDVVPDEHFALAETDDEFVRSIALLLDDPRRRASLGTAAHQWADANVSWERTARAFEDLHERLIAEAR